MASPCEPAARMFPSMRASRLLAVLVNQVGMDEAAALEVVKGRGL